MTFELWKHIDVDGEFTQSDSVLEIYKYLKDCKENNQNPYFNLVPEGFSIHKSKSWKVIQQLYQTLGYKDNEITVKTADLSAQFQCSIEKEPTFLYWVSDWMKDKNFEFTRYTPITFMHFIGRLQWDRVFIHYELTKNFADKTYYRLHGYGKNKGQIGKCCKDLLEKGFEHEETVEIIRKLGSLPVGNISNFEKKEKMGSEMAELVQPLQEYYHNGFIDIVHETDVSENNFFITEKTLRPMIFHRPFILFAGKNFLMKLKRLGFQTFASWWNEEYDMYHGKERAREIVHLIRSLHDLSIDQKRTMLVEMKPILENNYNLLKNKQFKI